MTKEVKKMEDQLNEEKLQEQLEEEAKAQAKKSKANQKRWYIVHTYSGYENKVKVNLEKMIENQNLGDRIFRIEVPQKTVTQIKGGKKTEKEEKVFPGYVLVEMIMDEETWYVVRHTTGVAKFVGSAKKPSLLKIAKSKKSSTAHLHKHKKSNLTLKLVTKLELLQDHSQNSLQTLSKFTLIKQNFVQMFQSLVVKLLLN